MAKRRDSNGRFMKSDDSSPKKSSSTKQEMQKEIDYLTGQLEYYKNRLHTVNDTLDMIETKFLKSLGIITILVVAVISELIIILK